MSTSVSFAVNIIIGTFERLRSWRQTSGWAGLGQAFAAQDEPEPALAAYRAAMKLWPSSHVPPLAMAVLCSRTGQLVLAQQYANLATARCRGDPLVYHELGAMAYKMGAWLSFIEEIHEASSLVRSNINMISSSGRPHAASR